MTTRNTKMIRGALAYARRILADERREQYGCFTLAPHKDDAETRKQMNATERWAIRRFDRAISRIDEAMKVLR